MHSAQAGIREKLLARWHRLHGDYSLWRSFRIVSIMSSQDTPTRLAVIKVLFSCLFLLVQSHNCLVGPSGWNFFCTYVDGAILTWGAKYYEPCLPSSSTSAIMSSSADFWTRSPIIWRISPTVSAKTTPSLQNPLKHFIKTGKKSREKKHMS